MFLLSNFCSEFSENVPVFSKIVQIIFIHFLRNLKINGMDLKKCLFSKIVHKFQKMFLFFKFLFMY